MSERTIKGYECKHVNFRSDGTDDVLLIKENIHYSDGTVVPNVRLRYNYERDFYVTKPGFRKHQQKKTYEKIERLQKFSSTQTKLVTAITKALGEGSFKGALRMRCRNPYVYGADVPTTVLVKRAYQTKYADCNTENSVAVCDIETNVHSQEQEILMISITYGSKAILAVTKAYLGTTPNAVQAFKEKSQLYIGEYLSSRNLDIELVITDNPGQAVAAVMRRAHEWRPDFIAIFNINFDMPRMIQALGRAGYDIGDVFSDPAVPQQFRTARYIEAPPQRVTASGKTTAPHPADLWHWLDCIASFTFVDSMSLYKKLRAAKGQESDYSLDYLLNKHLKLSKLKFDAVKDAEGTLEWHRIMQVKYKIEYMVYNIFDCIAVELLDAATKDIALSISVLCGSSDYAKFPSQPRRFVDDLHFFCLDEGYVIGTTSDQMAEDLDKYVCEITGWIVTLPSYQVADMGMPALAEIPDLLADAWTDVYDADCTSSYPNGQVACNISRATTRMEMGRMEGISDEKRRICGINLTGGHTNAVEICNTLFKYPDSRTLRDAYLAHRKQKIK